MERRAPNDPDHDDGRLRQAYNVGPYTFYDGTLQPDGVVRADPTHARGTREFHGELSGVGHHHMAHTVVAVDQGGRWTAFEHADGRTRVDGAALKLAHIAREAKDAVGIRAGESGLQHRIRHGAGIGLA